tara:strand:+ start:204 stop:1028 length:825 start_codon:yes stop_codon:yes gene_type:complete
MSGKKKAPYDVIRKKVNQYVSEHIDDIFYDKRIKKLKEKSSEALLIKLLRAKNPYMLRAVNCDTAEKLIKRIVGDSMSSSDEGMFGIFLEGLAIEISSIAIGGKKASAEGIDIDADYEKKRYQIAVKSGRVWGNAQSQKKQKDNFKQVAQTLKRHPDVEPVCILGICYGSLKESAVDKVIYQELVGERFWTFISGGHKKLYTDLIEPLAKKAIKHEEGYEKEYARTINRLVKLFTAHFVNEEGDIDWNKVVEFNSGADQEHRKLSLQENIGLDS